MDEIQCTLDQMDPELGNLFDELEIIIPILKPDRRGIPIDRYSRLRKQTQMGVRSDRNSYIRKSSPIGFANTGDGIFTSVLIFSYKPYHQPMNIRKMQCWIYSW